MSLSCICLSLLPPSGHRLLPLPPVCCSHPLVCLQPQELRSRAGGTAFPPPSHCLFTAGPGPSDVGGTGNVGYRTGALQPSRLHVPTTTTPGDGSSTSSSSRHRSPSTPQCGGRSVAPPAPPADVAAAAAANLPASSSTSACPGSCAGVTGGGVPALTAVTRMPSSGT